MFPREFLGAINARHYLIISGSGDGHRFLPIWSVVDGGRIFIRSWNLKPGGWHASRKRNAVPSNSRATGDEIAVRAKRVRSERVRDLVDEGFKKKYTTAASLKYVKGFGTKKRRDATFELVPA